MAEYSDYSYEQMYELLEALHDKYNCEEFIEADPISIPPSFARLEDQEIAGFLAATIAWGNRKAIVKSARRMMQYVSALCVASRLRRLSCRLNRYPYLLP